MGRERWGFWCTELIEIRTESTFEDFMAGGYVV